MDKSFNAAILTMAQQVLPKGYDVGPDAPNTLEELKDHFNATGRIKVWNGASDRTIFEDDEVNFAMRAWHDAIHLAYDLPFTPEGEAAVCIVQQQQLIQRYGLDERTQRWVDLLDAEINGQIAHEQALGRFPEDQKGFVLAYLANPEKALAQAW